MDELLRKAIVEAGGFEATASKAMIAPSHLYNICNGHKPLTARIMRRLRPHLKLSDSDWMALMADDRHHAPEPAHAQQAEGGQHV